MSLINKMLLDLDRRVDKGEKKSAAARVLEGLRPATKAEPVAPVVAVAPSSRRYELVGLMVVVLLAMGAYTWQKMAPVLPSLDTLVSAASESSVADPFVSEASDPVPVIHAPILQEEAIAVEEVTATPEKAPVAPVAAGAEARPAIIEPEDTEPPQDDAAAKTIPKAVDLVASPKPAITAPKVVIVPPPPQVAALPKRRVAPVFANPVVPAIAPVLAAAAPPTVAPPTVIESRPPAAIGAVPAAPFSTVGVEKKSVGISADVGEDLHSEAAAFFEQGRLAEAHAKYRDVLAHDPSHIRAREGLVNMALQQGNWEEAQELLYEGIGVVPGHVGFSQQLARLYAEQGNNEKALTVLESNREAAKANAEYVGFLAAVYQRLGRPTQAREAYAQALALRPLDGRLWTGLAIAYEAEQNWSAAREAYTRVRTSTNLDQKLSEYAERRLVALSNKM